MAPRLTEHGMMIVAVFASIVVILLANLFPQRCLIKPRGSNASLTLNGSLISNVSIAKTSLLSRSPTSPPNTPANLIDLADNSETQPCERRTHKSANPGHLTLIDELEAAGWTIERPQPDRESGNFYGRHNGPYQEFGIEESNGLMVLAVQDKEYHNHIHQNLPASCGQFENSYNPQGKTIVGLQGKTIVGLYNFSPRDQLENPLEPDAADLPPWQERLPTISKLSDVMWIIWVQEANKASQRGDTVDPGSLKFIFKHQVVTPQTQDIINAVVPNPESVPNPYNEQDPPFKTPWPGVTFNKGTSQFQALLGTPHGKGVVWLLVEHPNEMPSKDIESITLFVTEAPPEYHYEMLFTLSD